MLAFQFDIEKLQFEGSTMSETLRVMCVDDNVDAVETLGTILHHAGCHVLVCTRSTEALQLAREFLPDVCVLDLRMPGMDGCELARLLHAHFLPKKVRCIALTGYFDSAWDDIKEGRRFEDYFIKPCDPDEIINAVLHGPTAA